MFNTGHLKLVQSLTDSHMMGKCLFINRGQRVKSPFISLNEAAETGQD